MKTALIVWYLVLTSTNGGVAVVPIPYVSKEDCQGAATLFTQERRAGSGSNVYGNCLSQSQLKDVK